MTNIAVTEAANETCKACPYNRDGLQSTCDPVMGECRLEYEERYRREDAPRYHIVNGEEVPCYFPVEDY